MPSRSLSAVVQHLRSAAGRDGGGRTDGELLALFLSRRDEDALATLVERHAPMVWGVCRRVLRNPHDAEDAFQATFLVLVQKAETVVPREMVANWLHGVAHQTAVRLRATAAKRGWREMQMDVTPEPAVAEAGNDELLSRLDEELGRLPERFRALIVLCDLEGRTRKEVARHLGCPEGTVASGLARARELLAKRLTRRGLAVSGGSLAAALSHSVAVADVQALMVSKTIKAASLTAAGQVTRGVISVKVAALTEGVLKAMFLSKIKSAAGVLMLAVCLIGVGSALVLGEQPKEKKADGNKADANEADANEAAVKAMQERLRGTWKCVSMHFNGAKSEPDVVSTIKGNTWETKRDGAFYQSGTFKLVDLDGSPKKIEWVVIDAKAEAEKGMTFHGIFMLDGDLLFWNNSDAAKYPRPLSFFSEKDDGCCAGVFKRTGPKTER